MHTKAYFEDIKAGKLETFIMLSVIAWFAMVLLSIVIAVVNFIFSIIGLYIPFFNPFDISSIILVILFAGYITFFVEKGKPSQ